MLRPAADSLVKRLLNHMTAYHPITVTTGAAVKTWKGLDNAGPGRTWTGDGRRLGQRQFIPAEASWPGCAAFANPAGTGLVPHGSPQVRMECSGRVYRDGCLCRNRRRMVAAPTLNRRQCRACPVTDVDGLKRASSPSRICTMTPRRTQKVYSRQLLPCAAEAPKVDHEFACHGSNLIPIHGGIYEMSST